MGNIYCKGKNALLSHKVCASTAWAILLEIYLLQIIQTYNFHPLRRLYLGSLIGIAGGNRVDL